MAVVVVVVVAVLVVRVEELLAFEVVRMGPVVAESLGREEDTIPVVHMAYLESQSQVHRGIRVGLRGAHGTVVHKGYSNWDMVVVEDNQVVVAVGEVAAGAEQAAHGLPERERGQRQEPGVEEL